MAVHAGAFADKVTIPFLSASFSFLMAPSAEPAAQGWLPAVVPTT